MKMLLLCVLCVVTGRAVGSAVFWPGAIPLDHTPALVNSYISPQVKTFGYSSNQFINAVPHSYAVKYQPQFALQVPFNRFSPLQGYHTYQPVISASYYPQSSLLYPPILQGASVVPINTIPEPTKDTPQQEQPGDEDTAVIESADTSNGQTERPSSVSSNMPGFSQISQAPGQAPQFPPLSQFPQFGFGMTQPQVPQPPQFPQFPQLPPNPPQSQTPTSSPPSSFPSADNTNSNFNDDDTVSIESA